MLNGDTRLIAHIGHPATTFKAPLIYNPWFTAHAINAAVVPMGVKREDFAAAFPAIRRFSNFGGALITMPHKVAVVEMLDEVSTTAKICGACNAVRRDEAGRLIGDMFDGEGFVRGMRRNGVAVAGKRALVIGAGGVGAAIAASLAAVGLAHLALYDVAASAMEALAGRLTAHYPALEIALGRSDPQGFDIVVNATPLGMAANDPPPFDLARLAPATYVGEVVLSRQPTPLLAAARALGCPAQAGLDMLFEQIPACLEFFGFPLATVQELRALAQIPD